MQQSIPSSSQFPKQRTCQWNILIPYSKIVKRIVLKESIAVSLVTRDKIYPVVNGLTGSIIASRFLHGLAYVGLGEFSSDQKTFKRIHPDDAKYPEVKEKWMKLNL